MKFFQIGALLFVLAQPGWAQHKTSLEIVFPSKPSPIDPMIYGQMLENVNDSMIYGGVADMQGNEQLHITPLVKELDIPVMRWPGGTVIYEYRWRSGIGPRAMRPKVPTLAWKGEESYQFGTDEFLQWCKRVGTAPYINFNMGSHPLYQGTLWEAMEWMEYVNGSEQTPLGKLRAYNGHQQPYNVKYWCIGNENYLPSRAARVQDQDTVYANRLRTWSATIKAKYPEVKLLGVGRSIHWNKTVMERSGNYLHYLTQHYYVNAKVKDGNLVNASSTLFAPAKMEAHLKLLGNQLKGLNRQLNRSDDPVRLCVDEWNNRHAVYDGNSYKFTRQSVRKQFDVAVTAGMLNVFIRQSPTVGMANYIFPVNAHGLIRTVGTDDAYLTPIYYLFKQYRSKMLGNKVDVLLKGPGVPAVDANVTIDGDSQEITMGDELLTFVDAAAVVNDNKQLVIALINRSPDKSQLVEMLVPPGYKTGSIWELKHTNINAMNSADNRFEIVPSTRKLTQRGNKASVQLLPCAFAMVELEKINN
ncbi:alpha-L-arabinofuranosidase C-terminal domain-containing protein [Flavihumibacter sp. UBA7668]|uniref:alpha-L-arabinofuranosidase C-terminal domain-containing protein n=1 Tax=Flavihumibacter sp. UBA7668 TaxID=1946542 RepID=UPI0025BFA692|nr:alpha-L-arabinofuranosidase C-terminal domain-containing protein [Flavihumibacter sp. UBA7668]